MPLTWLFAILLFILFIKDPKRKRKFLIITIIGLYILSNEFLANEAMHLWEIPAVPEEQLGHYDAGIVLSGMLQYDIEMKKYQFSRGSDRLLQALILYKKKKISKIVFTGGSGSITYSYIKEGILIRNFLLRMGIPASDIIIESESKNTHENAVFTKPLLDKEFPNGKFLLITSGYHMRRSLACFKKAGIVVTPYTTDRQSGPRKFIFDHLFIPNLSAIETWQTVFHEMSGLLMYKLAGYG